MTSFGLSIPRKFSLHHFNIQYMVIYVYLLCSIRIGQKKNVYIYIYILVSSFGLSLSLP